MKKLLILFLLITSPVYALDESKVSGPDTLFGGGGVAEGSDVTFGNMTVVGNLVVRQPGGVAGTDEAVLSHDGTQTLLKSNDGYLRLHNDTDKGLWVAFSSLIIEADLVWPNILYRFAIRSTQESLRTEPVFVPRWDGSTKTGIGGGNSQEVSIIVNAIEKARFGNTTTILYPSGPGSLLVNGGIKTAFRNLSSAAETLTSADYFINCLANDNEVVMTMPPVDAAYSQTLMVKYTDSGSTNKCKLDGNGAEQVEGFDVYSGLDTYKEACIFKSDESGWWITGCI